MATGSLPPAAHVAATPRPAVIASDELYSKKARRRLAALLRLQLDELRLQRLDRVRAAVERGLGPPAFLEDR